MNGSLMIVVGYSIVYVLLWIALGLVPALMIAAGAVAGWLIVMGALKELE